MFNKNDIVVAKDEYIDKHETVESTAGIVLDHNPETDYLVLGVLHPEKYAIPPTFSMRGECYRLATEQEKQSFMNDPQNEVDESEL